MHLTCILNIHSYIPGRGPGKVIMVNVPASSHRCKNTRWWYANVDRQLLPHKGHPRLIGTQARTVATLEAEATGSRNVFLIHKIAHLAANLGKTKGNPETNATEIEPPRLAESSRRQLPVQPGVVTSLRSSQYGRDPNREASCTTIFWPGAKCANVGLSQTGSRLCEERASCQQEYAIRPACGARWRSWWKNSQETCAKKWWSGAATWERPPAKHPGHRCSKSNLTTSRLPDASTAVHRGVSWKKFCATTEKPLHAAKAEHMQPPYVAATCNAVLPALSMDDVTQTSVYIKKTIVQVLEYL